MKRKPCFAAAALALLLSLSPGALAAGVEDRFPAVNPYPGYADVTGDAWYADAARVCYETGLITGTADGSFSPESAMNVAQAATLAVRIREILNGGDGVIETPEGQPWYAGAISAGIALASASGDVRLLSRLADPESLASRADFFALMSLAVEEDLLTPINTVVSLPDTADTRVLAFYEAGILNGLDRYGSFKGGLTLRRCEAALMAARLVRPQLRQSFTLETVPILCQAAGVLPETVFFQGEKPVTALEYLTAVEGLIRELETACAAQGMDFNWLNTYGDQTFLAYVRERAIDALGVTTEAGSVAWRAFDLQVFYSRLIDLTGAGGSVTA